MEITTRGKGIPEFSIKRGMMTVEFSPNEEKTVWLKLDVSGKEQYIVELTKFEIARVIAVGILDDEVMEICERNGWLRKEVVR